MNFRNQRDVPEVRIELTPLIDVVFQLLIFFLLTTSFIAERAIEVELPAANEQAKSRDEKRILAVTVSRDGGVAHDGAPLSLAALGKVFARAATAQQDPIVIIRGDHAVSHGRVVEVMDLARGHGLNQLAIATVPKQAEGDPGR